MSDYAQHEHHEFLAASDEALANASLQLALARLGDTLGQRNRDAFQALDSSDDLRDRARAIKDETLAELDKHLATLDDSIRRRGGHVHYAVDGAEACRQIVDIIRSKGGKIAVKSKSMTSEEIHLNPALEAAGITAVETDFGEFIIQVAGQRPSHLVAPALHLSVPEVAVILGKISPSRSRRTPPNWPPSRVVSFANSSRGRTSASREQTSPWPRPAQW